MDYTRATDEQLINIIEWDIGIPTPLLKEVYEEVVKRRILDQTVFRWINSRYKSKVYAESLTGLALEDLLWIGYEVGYEIITNDYKPTHPFIGYWCKSYLYTLRNISATHKAEKRQAEVCSLEDIYEWKMPRGNHTERIALNRIYIESLMNQLSDTEKNMILKRYQGYSFKEIGEMYGLTQECTRKRIVRFQKRLKGA